MALGRIINHAVFKLVPHGKAHGGIPLAKTKEVVKILNGEPIREDAVTLVFQRVSQIAKACSEAGGLRVFISFLNSRVKATKSEKESVGSVRLYR